ncbi:MAG TPA: AbrB/MazE/SpoVT family DNA-binding domain-containing protein [Alloacidobacterium sp.]|nr:AbrB/MazE/SpoVT family DNA-binding domain-containing protein [Alloacidobacterium sp.]
METRLSTKGQIVLPGPLRRKLGLRAGDSFEASIETGRIVLTPRNKRSRKARILTDPLTGLPVLSVQEDAPALSSDDVEEILANFP